MPAQLRERGLDPGEIPVVVMTHLHIDHTSAISEFPNSTFVVSETEWEAAATGSQPDCSTATAAPHFDYAFDYRTIDFDRGGIDSYATFGRTFDLFGDGSIRLAYTPGHSAGHMSVIARLAERDFVIGGDAIYTLGQLERRRAAAAAPLRRPQLPPLAAGAEAVPAASIPDAIDHARGTTPSFYAAARALATSSAVPSYISRTRSKISSPPRAGARGSGACLDREAERLAELDGDLGEAQPLPAAHPGRAVDRDRDDGRPRLQRDAADAGLRLAQLAACASARPRRRRAASRPGRGSCRRS